MVWAAHALDLIRARLNHQQHKSQNFVAVYSVQETGKNQRWQVLVRKHIEADRLHVVLRAVGDSLVHQFGNTVTQENTWFGTNSHTRF